MPGFTYTPFVDPNAGTLADIIRQRGASAARAAANIGQIQAQNALQKGQASAQMWGSLGEIARSIPQQLAAERQRKSVEAEHASLAAERDAQTRQRTAALDDAQQDQAALVTALSTNKNPDGTPNWEGALSTLKASRPKMAAQLADDLTKAQSAIDGIKKGKEADAQHQADVTARIVGSADSPEQLQRMAGIYVAEGKMDPQAAEALRQQVSSLDPAGWQEFQKAHLAASPTVQKELADLAHTKAETEKALRPPAPTTRPPTTFDAAILAETDPVKRDALIALKAKAEAAGRAPTPAADTAPGGEVSFTRPTGPNKNTIDPKTGYTPVAIFQHGIENALTGRTPTLGMGGKGTTTAARQAIQNTAAALADAAGTDLGTLQAEYKANAGTLSKLLPQATATANAANTAKDNLDLALKESANVPRGQSKLANRYVNWIEGNLSPKTGLTKLEVYIYTAAREYAKVTSGGAASSQGLTDSAAKEAEKLLNAAQAPETLAAAIEAMQGDMSNIVGEQAKGLARVSKTIGDFFAVANGTPPPDEIPTSAPPPAPPVKPVASHGPSTVAGFTFKVRN